MARTKDVTSRIMASVKNRDSVAEFALRRRLWANGIRYRLKNDLCGRPDLVFASERTAVFVDGDLWHGNSWRVRGLPDLESQFPNNTLWWTDKIKANMARDAEVTQHLEGEGWKVLRFWESTVLIDPNGVAREIAAILRKAPRGGVFVELPLSSLERRRLASVVPRKLRAGASD